MKKFSLIFIIFTMVLMSISFGEGYKEESIYGLISETGSVDKVYVVNTISGLDFDYGPYDAIENLTNLKDLEKSDSKIVLPDYENTFYYQGILDAPDLPWDFNLEYSLDGQAIKLKDLAGASGKLKIKIQVQPGAQDLREFYKAYALQIGLSFSNESTQILQAEGATIVEAGGKKQVTFTVLPGQGGIFEVTGDIKDFEMDPMTINGVKMAFDISIDTQSLTEDLQMLTQGVEEVNQGATDLLKALKQVSNGFSDYSQGMEAFKNGLYDLSGSSVGLVAGLQEVTLGLEALKNQEESLKGGLGALKNQTFLQVDEKLKAMGLDLPALNENNYESILGQDENLIPIIIELEQSLQFLNGMGQYIETVGILSGATKDISQGFQAYSQGVSDLALSSQSLYENAQTLNRALVDIKKGMITYQEGTQAFKDQTQNIDQDMENKMNEILGDFSNDHYEIQSFASAENESVLSVQFFFRTEGVKKEVVKAEIVEEKPTTLWQRIKNLFSFLD